jgi:predicted DNA binding CopG/RHH family protein
MIIFRRGDTMRDEYDFSNAVKNPYATDKKKKQISINIDINTIDFFKRQAATSGIPYQTLINLYLTDCAEHNRQLQTVWK